MVLVDFEQQVVGHDDADRPRLAGDCQPIRLRHRRRDVGRLLDFEDRLGDRLEQGGVGQLVDLERAVLLAAGYVADDADESDEDVSVEEEVVEGPGLSAMTPAIGADGVATARPGIVHRIDKGTSGLLVVAKTDIAHARLAAQFAAHTIEREYLALVWGVPAPTEQRIETDLGRDPRDRKKVAVAKEGKGKRAVTHLRVLDAFGDAALVAFRLETGRTHQIRVHARHIGHTLVGDLTYGGGEVPRRIVGSRRAMFQNIVDGLQRQALHAHVLGVRHPSTGEALRLTSTLPADMEDALRRLRRATASYAVPNDPDGRTRG